MTSFQRLGLSSAATSVFVPAAAWLTDFAWTAVGGLSLLFFVGAYFTSFYVRPNDADDNIQGLKEKARSIARDSTDFRSKLVEVLEQYPEDYGQELQNLNKKGKFLADPSDKILQGMLVLSNKLEEVARLLEKKPRLIYGNERIFILMPLANNLLGKLAQHDVNKLSPETQTKCQEGMRLLIQATQELFQSSKSANEKDLAVEVRVLEDTLKLM